jgi:hypothetical protein
MKETTVLNNISKLADKINYKYLYVEIDTGKDKYTLEKDNNRKIGFDAGGNNEYKSKHK